MVVYDKIRVHLFHFILLHSFVTRKPITSEGKSFYKKEMMHQICKLSELMAHIYNNILQSVFLQLGKMLLFIHYPSHYPAYIVNFIKVPNKQSM